MALNIARFILVYTMTCYWCIFYRNRYGVNNVILSDILKPKDKELLEGMYNIHIHYYRERERREGRQKMKKGDKEEVREHYVQLCRELY